MFNYEILVNFSPVKRKSFLSKFLSKKKRTLSDVLDKYDATCSSTLFIESEEYLNLAELTKELDSIKIVNGIKIVNVKIY